jgi:hypothetical protein
MKRIENKRNKVVKNRYPKKKKEKIKRKQENLH